MALRTQVWDAGATEPRTLPHGWGGFHLEALVWMLDQEGQADKGWPDEYEFTGTWVAEDEADGEVFIVRPGDRLVCWRS